MKKYRLNNQIRVSQVFLIDDNDEKLGVMDINKALDMAREHGLDLVEVAPNASPPVCKLLNFGKFLYRIAKQERRHSAKQKKSEVKVARIGFKTGKHDLEVKAKKATEFLNEGHQLKAEVVLRGREKRYMNLAKQKLVAFIELIPVETKIIQEPKKFPSGFSMVVVKAH